MKSDIFFVGKEIDALVQKVNFKEQLFASSKERYKESKNLVRETCTSAG